MKIYIAGRITNNPNYKEEFARAEKMLTEYGHTVINPVKANGFSYKDYIDMGLAQLSKCDAIYMLNKSELSKGAMLEQQYADTVGIEVIREDEDCDLEIYECETCNCANEEWFKDAEPEKEVKVNYWERLRKSVYEDDEECYLEKFSSEDEQKDKQKDDDIEIEIIIKDKRKKGNKK